MRYVILIAVFSLMSVFEVSGQEQQAEKKDTQVHIDIKGKTYKWIKVAKKNDAGFDCFFYQVERSIKPNKKGLYEYNVYFLSNSNIGKKRLSTNIEDLKILVKDGDKLKLAASEPYVLIKPKSADYDGKYLGVKFTSAKNNLEVQVKWKDYKAY